MVFDTRVLPEPTAKQQEVTLQGGTQMVMNMESQPKAIYNISLRFLEKVCHLLQVIIKNNQVKN